MYQRYIRYTFCLMRNVKNHYNHFHRTISTSNRLLLQEDENRDIVEEEASHLKRSVPLSEREFRSRAGLKPLQPENPRVLKVSILGEPNVGKSTLTNRLAKWRVCAMSSKVHTTRKKARAVLVEENTQIVFLDTPGFVTPEKTKRHSLEASFVMDPLKSIRYADLLAVVVDIADKWTNNRINPEILRILYDFKHKKSILILNKIDAMKSKSRFLSFIRILTDNESLKNTKSDHETQEKLSADEKEISVDGSLNEANEKLINPQDLDPNFYENIEHKRGWPLFSKIFMVSALKDDGIDDLRNYMLNEAIPRDWIFPEGMVTDQHPHEIALMTLRENLLEYLPNEIPYKLDLKIKKWEMLSTGCPKIDMVITCPKPRHRSFVIGPDGKHIAACVAKCKKAMRESFRRDVVLKVAVE